MTEYSLVNIWRHLKRCSQCPTSADGIQPDANVRRHMTEYSLVNVWRHMTEYSLMLMSDVTWRNTAWLMSDVSWRSTAWLLSDVAWMDAVWFMSDVTWRNKGWLTRAPLGGLFRAPPLVFLRYLLNRCRYHRQTCSTLSPNIFTHRDKILKSMVS